MIRKKCRMVFAMLVFVFLLAAGIQPAYASGLPSDATEEAEPVTRVTVAFKANGGKGSMGSIVVESGTPATLPANTFKKTGYQFAGWATGADGSGTYYADRADVTELASAYPDGTRITLYAQWKLQKPEIKKVKSPDPSSIKVTFDKVKSVSGYEIQYSTGRAFKKTVKTVKAAKTATSAELLEVTPNKKYYVRMRSYKTGGETKYSDWSKIASVKVKNGKTIANTKCATAIEADVKLTGSGTGYHAKFVMGNATSAVSFGMQYDSAAEAPYTGKNMALIENISSNNAGGQRYVRPGNVALRLNKTYHLMMTIDEKGRGDVYVDYKKIGSFYQPNLTTLHWVRIEACARLNGDSVDAVFSNVKYRIARGADLKVLGDDLEWDEIKLNKGLKYKYNKKDNSIRMYGTITGINGDWDSDYESVSEILQFR